MITLHFQEGETIVCKGIFWLETVEIKDFRAFGVADKRRMTAATAAFTLAHLFTEWLCYVLGRLHSSYELSTVRSRFKKA